MSKERQIARAERARAAARAAATRETERNRAAAERARRERRSLLWRSTRLWQHGPAFRRRRESWGALATLILLILLLVWLFSRSWTNVLVTALALVICTPVLVLFVVDRRHR